MPLTTSSNEIYNPDALAFLTNANSFNIGSHRVRSFYQRVIVNKKEALFQAEGFHTFFIPVEEGFKVISSLVLCQVMKLSGKEWINKIPSINVHSLHLALT